VNVLLSENQGDLHESSTPNVRGKGIHMNQAPQWEILVMSTFILGKAKHGKMHAVNLDLTDHQT